MSSNCTSTTAVAVAPLSASKTKTKKKHFVCQKVKLFRASEPILSVLMWGVNHTVSSSRALPRPPQPWALAPQALPVTPATPRQATCTPTPPLHAFRPRVRSPHATRGLVSVVCRRHHPFPPAPLASCMWRARLGQPQERRGKAWELLQASSPAEFVTGASRYPRGHLTTFLGKLGHQNMNPMSLSGSGKGEDFELGVVIGAAIMDKSPWILWRKNV
ncbi:Phosphatidylinositol 5-phosphate 4-kinase type-2 beta [Plecturocebus cupreus]